MKIETAEIFETFLSDYKGKDIPVTGHGSP
jgi:hypothetical protein